MPFLAGFFTSPNYEGSIKIKDELFEPVLLKINSIDKAADYIDGQYEAERKSSGFDTADYVKIVSKFTKSRFYHGLSHYNIHENWIAFLAGKLLWSHLSAIVDPNDILKHPDGLCSQQTIVFLELLKGKGIKARSIGLGYPEGPGHFLSEVYYEGSWHLYDISAEPVWKRIYNDHKSMDYYMDHKDSLYVVYDSRIPKDLFDKITQKISFGEINDFPAKNMLLLHKTTKIITYLLPVLFLFMFFLYYKKHKASL